MELRCFFQKHGFLPPTIYIQVDGGSENANAVVLALCELIVVKRLHGITKFVFSRLLPGHTHDVSMAVVLLLNVPTVYSVRLL